MTYHPSGRQFILGLGWLAFLTTVPSLPAAPAEVIVSQPVQRLVTDTVACTGRLAAVQTVELRPRGTGYLQKIYFKGGTEVKKGDLLFEMDPRVYQAALTRALAEQALAEARLKRADAEYQRARALLARKAISKEDVDKISAGFEVERAALKAAQANSVRCRLDLDFTRITAPMNGRIGLPLVTVGNLLNGNGGKASLLATIVSMDPMYVIFDLNERILLRLQKEKIKDGKIAIQVGLVDEVDYPHQGVLDGIDNKVQMDTGTVRARGLLGNPRHLFRPGAFARVRLPVGKPHKALLVKEAAVLSEGAKKFLLVVNDKEVVERREVKWGGLHDGMRSIEAGLKPGEWIVVSGHRGLEPGAKVKPVRKASP
jgi:RND family efflux transporter MFP subunit